MSQCCYSCDWKIEDACDGVGCVDCYVGNSHILVYPEQCAKFKSGYYLKELQCEINELGSRIEALEKKKEHERRFKVNELPETTTTQL